MFRKRRQAGVGKTVKFKKLEELVLPNARLRFCPEQLQNLNFVFNRNLQSIEADKKLILAKSVAERLTQRLLCGAARLDSRFSSKFLISNKYRKNNVTSTNLEYIVRLDCLSTPKLYESDTIPDYSIIETDSEIPPGYARLRLNSTAMNTWTSFTNSSGYLRRDKVQARLVELLAMAASQETPSSPLYVDETVCCGIPGKIVNPLVLHDILKIPANEQVFYGPGGNIPRFPDPRDFRLAIIDEPNGIKLKVEFLSPALSNISINVLILLAIGLDSWPSTSDFPSRISLGHSDCLLYHQAAQTGVYLVGYGVQSSAWQMRLPAAEYMILNHYSVNSTVNTILEVLYGVLDDIDHNRGLRKKQLQTEINFGIGHFRGVWLAMAKVRRAQVVVAGTCCRCLGHPHISSVSKVSRLVASGEPLAGPPKPHRPKTVTNIDENQAVSYKILNKYMLLTCLLEELENNSHSPFLDMLNWSPIFLSTHVLKLLDNIVAKLQSEFQPSYFFKKANLLVNPGHLCDDDFNIEANNVKSYMAKLFDESLTPIRQIREFENSLVAQESELNLIFKWKEIVDGLLPPPSTRGRRFCFTGISRNEREVVHTQYTNRQLEYVGLLLKNMLGVKQKILKIGQNIEDTFHPLSEFEKENHMEDVVYVLVSIMDQAKDQFLSKQSNPNILKNKAKIRSNYNHYTSKLVELVRKDKELQNLNLENDVILVKTILKWLYKAMDHNKRHFAPILRPYLSTIFTSSRVISCQLQSIKQRLNNDELKALGAFCKLVNNGKITPAQGLIDSVNKNWNWARNMLGIVEKHTLRLVFISERDKVYRHILSLPSYQKNDLGSRTLEGSVKGRKEIRRQKTLPNRSYFNSILNERNKLCNEDIIPQHDKLRSSSPLSLILRVKNRRGQHRGSGDIFKSMASMQKLNMFQDAASALPQEDRTELSEFIQNLQSSKLKRSLNKKWSATLPSLNTISKYGEDIQRYIPKEESAGIKLDNAENCLDFKLNAGTLLGTCRAARIREDSSVFLLEENFKVKKMLNKSESFKY